MSTPRSTEPNATQRLRRPIQPASRSTTCCWTRPKAGKPVLGICFGVQSLNVWRGGSLVQDLTPLPVNHSAGSKVAIAHTALVAKDSVLASLLTDAGSARGRWLSGGCRSIQAITSRWRRPAQDSRIVARCPEDGVIEAVEMDADDSVFHVEHPAAKQFVLGVQWHPERSFEISAASRALFRTLGG